MRDCSPKFGGNSVPLRVELQGILTDVGPKNVWRPVCDEDHWRMADGIADWRDGHPVDIARVDFEGKSVLDVGCNFGFYTFLAKRLGARWVLGVDENRQIIRGASILKTLHGVRDVNFVAADFIHSPLPDAFDIGLLINFLGKKKVRRGIHRFLDALVRRSRLMMVISVREYYRISEHFECPPDEMADIYSADYIRRDRFLLTEFIADYFRDLWDMTVISPDYNDPDVKRTLLFTRK